MTLVAEYSSTLATKVASTSTGTGKRKGGVIWHTQGSGKSLTMVMLAQAIALDKSIKIQRLLLLPTELIWMTRFFQDITL